jgi:hypothetical protein
MKLTKKIEMKLRSFDWKYIDETRNGNGIYEIKDPKKQEPERITVIDEEKICFYDNSGSDHACCIKLKDILFFNNAD